MKFLGRVLSYLAEGTSLVGSLLVVVLVCHVTLDVVLRYVFSAPLNGTILYVSLYYMTAISYLPVAAAQIRNSHISVEVVYELLPGVVQRFLTGLALLISALVFLPLTLRTWEEATKKLDINSFVMDSGARIETWPTYFFLPIGFGLMFLVLVYELVCVITGTRNGLIVLGQPHDPGAPVIEETSA